MFYQMPPAAVAPAVVFDSMAVSRDRRAFGRNVFRPAVYEPTEIERQQYVALMLAEQNREIEDRFLAYEFEDQAAGRLTDADVVAATGCC